jgi:hypothetical protein
MQIMSKKVKKNNQFGTTGSCDHCGKKLSTTSTVWQTTSLLSLWGKTFCSMKCAKAEGYEESKSWF